MEESQAPQSSAHMPRITIERFAELSSIEQGIVHGQIRNGHLSAVKVGRYRMLSVALLQTQCLTQEDWA